MERFGGLKIIWFVEICRKKDVEGRGEKGDNDIKCKCVKKLWEVLWLNRQIKN